MTADPQENEKQLKLTRASDVRAKKVHFLVKDLLPLGTLTVLAGNSGIGKTTIALAYLADITKGTQEGIHYGVPKDVIILSPEDDEASITRPRLEAAGADLNRVHFMSATRRTQSGEIETYVSFPEDIPMLVNAVKATNAVAVMIDPIASLIAGNLDKREDVRASFDRLAAEVAKEHDLSVLLIAHNRKGMAQVREKISGSAAITDAARSVLAVAENKENETVVMTVDKSSYSKAAGLSLEYKLVTVSVPIGPDNFSEVARAEFIGESDVSVSDLNAIQSGEEPAENDRSDIERHIYEYLFDSGGSAEAKEVIKSGVAHGFKEPEIKKARNRMRDPKVSSERQGFGKGAKYVWVMDTTMETMDAGVSNTGTHGIHVEPMLEGLAPVTPIGGERS